VRPWIPVVTPGLVRFVGTVIAQEEGIDETVLQAQAEQFLALRVLA
jgi:hypothetical protein